MATPKKTSKSKIAAKKSPKKTARKPAARKPAAARATAARDIPLRTPRLEEEEPAAEQAAPKASPFQPGMAPECMACPFGMFFYALKNTKPEVMEHLMKGAFELMQAGKALVEQYTERWEQAETLERITIS